MTKFRLLEEGENPTTVPLEPERSSTTFWLVFGVGLLATGACAISWLM
jgi:hypothetical protein